jgi:hypothetical protein
MKPVATGYLGRSPNLSAEIASLAHEVLEEMND